MTDHRHLKQLVRARMARTGESYTTARRHLVTRVTIPGLVSGYDAVGTRQHHDSSLVGHLLRQAGHVAPHSGRPYGEAMVCGLGGGIGFMYALFEYTGVPPLITIVLQHHPEPWLPAVLDRLKIGYSERHSTSPTAAMTALHAELAADRAVYCLVDRSALPWHAGAPAISADPYGLVVAGVDGDTLYLDDRDPAPHGIAAADFATAWSRHRKGRHHRVSVDRPTGPADLPGAIRDAIATTVAHLTGPVLGNSFDVNFGFAGMRRLAGQLRDDRTKNGWLKRLAEPGALAWALRRLPECLESEYTAAGGTRPLYADFLDEAAGVVDDPRLGVAAVLLRESGGYWSRLATCAAEAVEALGPLADLAERRMAVVMTRGRAGADEIRALSQEIAAQPVPDIDRAGLFAELADLLDAARGVEERAVSLLS
jgi:hypothetical protein